MGSNFTTVTKNSLVSQYSKIELTIINSVVKYREDGNKENFNRELLVALQLFNSFAKSLSDSISSGFSEGTFIEPYILCDGELSQRMQSLLKDMIQQIITIMDGLNEIIKAELNDSRVELIYELLGKLSLELRFDLLSVPEGEIAGSANIGNVYAQLNRLNELNNDHVVVKNLWQNSSRKIFPSFSVTDTAIVMQGPIDYERDFTLETLMRYRRLYPDTMIILSTWLGEITQDLRGVLTAIGIVIVENEIPEYRGPSNIVCQLRSSLYGIRAAKENKEIKYLLKTRTDQAFYLPDFLLYFKNLLKTFPVCCDGMKERLLFLGTHGSMCTYPFRITDFMVFGERDDVEGMYSAPEVFERMEYTQSDSDIKNSQYLSVLKRAIDDGYYAISNMDKTKRMTIVQEVGQKQDPESFLIQSFCERIVYKSKINIEDDPLMLYWRFLKNCTIFTDPDELLFYWDKYSSKFIDISSNTAEGGLTHAAWTSIYHMNL